MREIKQSLALLKEKFARAGNEQASLQKAVSEIWLEWFGSELKTGIETINLKQKKLFLKTKNKSVANELWLRRSELLTALRAKQLAIEEVRIY